MHLTSTEKIEINTIYSWRLILSYLLNCISEIYYMYYDRNMYYLFCIINVLVHIILKTWLVMLLLVLYCCVDTVPVCVGRLLPTWRVMLLLVLILFLCVCRSSAAYLAGGAAHRFARAAAVRGGKCFSHPRTARHHRPPSASTGTPLTHHLLQVRYWPTRQLDTTNRNTTRHLTTAYRYTTH